MSEYTWQDNPTQSGIAQCDTDVLNDDLMHLKYNNSERFIGEIIPSVIPLTDSGLHLLDGAVIQGGGIYDEFVQYIGEIYENSHMLNGVKWTTPLLNTNLGSNKIWYDVIYADNKFMALGRHGYISTSNDGVTWTNATQRIYSSDVCSSIAYDGEQYVCIGQLGYISTSTDGTTWTTPTQNANLAYTSVPFWEKIVYDGEKFVALDSTGYISTSTDGTTWTTATQSAELGNNSWYGLAYGNNKFVALGYNGYISTSIDGINWTTATQNSDLGSNNWWRIIYGDHNFFALSSSGYVSRSSDGITWLTAIQNENLDDTTDWNCLTYGESVLVAISSDGYISYSLPELAGGLTSETYWQNYVNTYGVCGKFVYTPASGNDPATVRLPKITGIVEGTTDLVALGDLVEAGLPNITGGISTYTWDASSYSGAFSGTKTAGSNAAANGSAGYVVGDFDASRSSSIYGNSSTVQPQTIKILYYIVIATSAKTDIEVDIDEIVTDLSGKADTDLSNISASASAKNTIINWGMPDYANGISMGMVIGSTGYTAPSSGEVYIRLRKDGRTGKVDIYINGTSIFYTDGANATTDSSFDFPVTKGDVITIVQDSMGGFELREQTFFPLKGAS